MNQLKRFPYYREYPKEYTPGKEAYYPVNDEKNAALYMRYKQLAEQETEVIFGGRLAEYRYYDMDAVIRSALDMVEMLCKKAVIRQCSE